MDFSSIDFIVTGAASALGFAVGWGASWAAGRVALDQSREQLKDKDAIIEKKDGKIREQGRQISEFVAEKQARIERLREAGRNGAAVGNARRQAKAALTEAATKVTKPVKTKR